MKQTKAAFRNKPFISLKGSILFLILIPIDRSGSCAIFHGNNRTVDDTYCWNARDRYIYGGVNFLPEQVTPSVFSFPTMNYFVDMTLFSFIEFTYRMTLLKMTTGTGRTGYHNQDRSNTIRIRPIKRKPLFSGCCDWWRWSFDWEEDSILGSLLWCVDKDYRISFRRSIGCHSRMVYSSRRLPGINKGPFGGVRYTPSFCKELNWWWNMIRMDGIWGLPCAFGSICPSMCLLVNLRVFPLVCVVNVH